MYFFYDFRLHYDTVAFHENLKQLIFFKKYKYSNIKLYGFPEPHIKNPACENISKHLWQSARKPVFLMAIWNTKLKGHLWNFISCVYGKITNKTDTQIHETKIAHYIWGKPQDFLSQFRQLWIHILYIRATFNIRNHRFRPIPGNLTIF